MRRLHILFACAALVSTTASAEALAAPWDKPGWKVTFHDELDGTSVDPASWGKRYKWGEAVINQELQAYVDDAFEFDNGLLRIVGKHEQGLYAGKTLDYRSGIIASVHEQKFGWFEIRCRMPAGKGLWPAFWLLGKNGSPGVNEIDIHEFLGHETDKVYMTIHWGTDYGAGHESSGTSFTGPDLTADFHTFAVEWDQDRVVWYVDGVERFKHEGEGVPQVEMYMIANLAIGGSWPGSPDQTTTFPAYYDIDYVRAYERSPDGPDGGPVEAGAEDANTEDAGAADVAAQDATGTDAGAEGAAPDSGADASSAGDAALEGSVGDGAAGAGPAVPQPPEQDDGGCGCRVADRGAASGFGAFSSLSFAALVGLLRRRPERRRNARH